jgi:hypothetical protein
VGIAVLSGLGSNESGALGTFIQYTLESFLGYLLIAFSALIIWHFVFPKWGTTEQAQAVIEDEADFFV